MILLFKHRAVWTLRDHSGRNMPIFNTCQNCTSLERYNTLDTGFVRSIWHTHRCNKSVCLLSSETNGIKSGIRLRAVLNKSLRESLHGQQVVVDSLETHSRQSTLHTYSPLIRRCTPRVEAPRTCAVTAPPRASTPLSIWTKKSQHQACLTYYSNRIHIFTCSIYTLSMFFYTQGFELYLVKWVSKVQQ